MYYWLNYIIKKYWNEIIYDHSKTITEISDDSDDYESIYDST